jgi:hypothetical protein
MLKLYTVYGMKNGQQDNKVRMTATSEEMKQRSEGRSGLSSFNKALKSVVKPPTT